MKYLDNSGLNYFWTKIKTYFINFFIISVDNGVLTLNIKNQEGD